MRKFFLSLFLICLFALPLQAAQYQGVGSFAMISLAPPSAAPVGVFAVAGGQQVTIQWDAVTGATSYNLYWATSSEACASKTKITGVSNPYTKTGLTNTTPYYFNVTAVSAGGESACSSEVTATPATQYCALCAYASSGDGYAADSDAVWATARAATTGGSYNKTAATAAPYSNVFSTYNINRTFLPFDTSSLTSSATITSVSLGLKCAHLYSSSGEKIHAVTTSLTSLTGTADYNIANWGSSTAGNILAAAWAEDIYSTMAIDTGVITISKTGSTYIGLRGEHDYLNSAATTADQVWIYTSEQGTGYKPYLYIPYTLATQCPTPNLLLNPNIKFAYSFENGATDSSGSRNDLTSSGLAYSKTALVKSGIYSLYNTGAGYASRTNNNLAANTPGKVSTPFTVGGWVRTTSIAAVNDILYDWYPGVAISYSLNINTSGHIVAQMYDSTPAAHTITSSATLSINTNYFVAMSWDGAQLHLFIGTDSSSATEDANSPINVSSMYYSNSSSAVLQAGVSISPDAVDYVDDIAGFNRPLLLTEIQSWQNHGLNGSR